MKYREWLDEASHSYKVYLMCSGVVNTTDAKLPLLKWPDIAHSSYDLIRTMGMGNDPSPWLKYYERDLGEAIYLPIEYIYQATLKRTLLALSVQELPHVESKAKKARDGNDWVQTKNRLIACINDLFNVLRAVTGMEYPELSECKHDCRIK